MALDYENLSDEELISRVRQRGVVDERAIAVLFHRHYPIVWKVCRRFMSTNEDAEDMLQDVFVRAHQGLSSFKGESRYSTWLYRISVNTCLNEIRRRKHRVELLEIPLEEISPHSDPLLHDDESDQRELNDELSAAMASLPDDARKALSLRDLDGHSYEEIARELGIKTSAAKMRVQRARLAMLAYLSEQQEP